MRISIPVLIITSTLIQARVLPIIKSKERNAMNKVFILVIFTSALSRTLIEEKHKIIPKIRHLPVIDAIWDN